MMRGPLVYAVALFVALAAAYWTWTHEDEADLSDKVVILPGDPEDLQKIVYESEELTLTLEMREDELGRYPWGSVEPKPKPEGESDAPDPSNPHAPPPESDEPMEFKGGKSAQTVIESLAPFTAKRILEGVDDYKLGELGLEDPDATLSIHRDGREPKTFELGGNVYGGANVYVRDPDSGTVYIVDARDVAPLRAGKRTLPERDLVGVALDDIARLTVQAGEAQASFEQHNPDDSEARFWSVAGEDEANATAAAWLDKVLRLRGTRYVQADEQPEALSEAYSFTVEPTDGQPVTVVVFRQAGEGDQEQWYASSPYTRGMVKLSRALAVETVADLQSVLEVGQSS